jgi:hypothetical protein
MGKTEAICLGQHEALARWIVKGRTQKEGSAFSNKSARVLLASDQKRTPLKHQHDKGINQIWHSTPILAVTEIPPHRLSEMRRRSHCGKSTLGLDYVVPR